MSTLPAIVARKIALLIPLLGSDKDGEVLGTVNALRRVLDGADLDLHDLAAVIESPPLPQWTTRQTRPPWQVLAADCLRQSGAYRLRPGERDFLISMSRWPGEPSERQWTWLEAIAAALDIERAAA